MAALLVLRRYDEPPSCSAESAYNVFVASALALVRLVLFLSLVVAAEEGVTKAAESLASAMFEGRLSRKKTNHGRYPEGVGQGRLCAMTVRRDYECSALLDQNTQRRHVLSPRAINTFLVIDVIDVSPSLQGPIEDGEDVTVKHWRG